MAGRCLKTDIVQKDIIRGTPVSFVLVGQNGNDVDDEELQRESCVSRLSKLRPL